LLIFFEPRANELEKACQKKAAYAAENSQREGSLATYRKGSVHKEQGFEEAVEASLMIV
jgi:hypothetical protein